MSTFVSVIVITKNNAQTIEKCITSLLNQNYPKDRYEIIFIDGLSSDGTRETIEKYTQSQNLPSIQLFTENVGTMGYARNVGISKSKGHILVFLDGDAYPTDNWVSQIVQSFNANSNLAILGGLDILTPENKTRDSISSWRRLKKSVGVKAISKIRAVNLAIKRDILNLCAGFDPKLSHFDEAELMARLYLKFKIKKVLFDPQLIVFHIREKSSLSGRIRKVFKKSVIGVPVLFRTYMIRMALLNPFSSVGTSLFFVFANFMFLLLLPFIVLGLIPLIILIFLTFLGLFFLFVYTVNIKRVTGKFLPRVLFILLIDCSVRFIGTFIGLIRWVLLRIGQKLKVLIREIIV